MSEFQAGTRKEVVVKRPASASRGVEGVEEENCKEERGEPEESDEEFGMWFLPNGEKRTKRWQAEDKTQEQRKQKGPPKNYTENKKKEKDSKKLRKATGRKEKSQRIPKYQERAVPILRKDRDKRKTESQ
ncbi:hypothetical protein NDU88_006092 [Pleurodeles waltl]|uniref:Uncharacterized protein n=1 Tax=Pleurodeles waltl TaxID=8319 RepID=A0AAV7NQY5_PLEWA|nr:hypothetical protein NDU88_006092 [Pleurodeles waltl]